MISDANESNAHVLLNITLPSNAFVLHPFSSSNLDPFFNTGSVLLLFDLVRVKYLKWGFGVR